MFYFEVILGNNHRFVLGYFGGRIRINLAESQVFISLRFVEQRVDFLGSFFNELFELSVISFGELFDFTLIGAACRAEFSRIVGMILGFVFYLMTWV